MYRLSIRNGAGTMNSKHGSLNENKNKEVPRQSYFLTTQNRERRE
jgi:hypothetical protein